MTPKTNWVDCFYLWPHYFRTLNDSVIFETSDPIANLWGKNHYNPVWELIAISLFPLVNFFFFHIAYFFVVVVCFWKKVRMGIPGVTSGSTIVPQESVSQSVSLSQGKIRCVGMCHSWWLLLGHRGSLSGRGRCRVCVETFPGHWEEWGDFTTC